MEIELIKLSNSLKESDTSTSDESKAFIDEINNELFSDDLILVSGSKEAKSSVIYVETGGTEAQFLELFPKLDDTVILLSSGKNNSLAACFEIKTYCNTHKLPAIIVTGKENYCAKVIAKFAHIAQARKNFENVNLGVIGKPSDWLIASIPDYEDIKKLFNINMVDISMDELFEEIDKKEYKYIPHKDSLMKKFKDYGVLEMSFCIYGALKRIIDKHQLSGLTIRCFDLLGKYKNTACLALGLLNEEGITAACEGDISTLLTMHLVRSITDTSSFQANPSCLDQLNKTMIFAHCTLPLNMVSKYELDTHFESNLGVAIKGEMPVGEITVCKLYINEDHNLENSIAVNATIKESNSLPFYCRTQVTVQMDEYNMMNYLKEDFGNHIVISYGNIVDDFYAMLSFYNLKAK